MEELARRFCRQALERPGLRYSEELRQVAVEYSRLAERRGHGLEPMVGQTEDAEEIDVEERSYKLVLHRRQKYRCSCNANVATAPGPLKLIPGGRYSLGF